MPTEDPGWKRCNTCKRSIAFRAPYFACSVSTCNRKGTDFAFCSVGCWDAHVPLFRHRDAWADEKTAPTAEEWERQERSEPRHPATPAPTAARPAASPTVIRRPGAALPAGSDTTVPNATATDPPPHSSTDVPRDVLVVVSKLKAYIRA